MNLYFKSKKLQLVITLSFIVALTNCKQTKENEQTMETNNVLLSEWIGPYGGVPAFDKMNIEDKAVRKGDNHSTASKTKPLYLSKKPHGTCSDVEG